MTDLQLASTNIQTDVAEIRQLSTAYKAILKLSGLALDYADNYQTPPIPRAYEVWYSYASGDSGIKEQIDSILEKQGSFKIGRASCRERV